MDITKLRLMVTNMGLEYTISKINEYYHNKFDYIDKNFLITLIIYFTIYPLLFSSSLRPLIIL